MYDYKADNMERLPKRWLIWHSFNQPGLPHIHLFFQQNDLFDMSNDIPPLCLFDVGNAVHSVAIWRRQYIFVSVFANRCSTHFITNCSYICLYFIFCLLCPLFFFKLRANCYCFPLKLKYRSSERHTIFLNERKLHVDQLCTVL